MMINSADERTYLKASLPNCRLRVNSGSTKEFFRTSDTMLHTCTSCLWGRKKGWRGDLDYRSSQVTDRDCASRRQRVVTSPRSWRDGCEEDGTLESSRGDLLARKQRSQDSDAVEVPLPQRRKDRRELWPPVGGKLDACDRGSPRQYILALPGCMWATIASFGESLF